MAQISQGVVSPPKNEHLYCIQIVFNCAALQLIQKNIDVKYPGWS